jgi:hypothetical protein
MNDDPSFEEVLSGLIAQSGFGRKVLIGGLLSFVPVLNFLAFGYLFRFSRRFRKSGDHRLPEWEDPRGLFLDGLRFTVVWLAYWLLPLLVLAGLSALLGEIGLGLVGYLLFAAGFALSPVLFSSALYRLQTRDDLRDLRDVALILRMTLLKLRSFLLPAFVFVGIFAVGWPVYGFAFFAGFCFAIAYAGATFTRLERRRLVFL